MDVKRSQQLRDMIALSQQMLALACDTDWESVARLENSRREIVDAFFAVQTHAKDAVEVRDAIKKILAMNQKLTELGHCSQDQLGRDIQTHNLGKTAQAAYQRCAR